MRLTLGERMRYLLHKIWAVKVVDNRDDGADLVVDETKRKRIKMGLVFWVCSKRENRRIEGGAWDVSSVLEW